MHMYVETMHGIKCVVLEKINFVFSVCNSFCNTHCPFCEDAPK